MISIIYHEAYIRYGLFAYDWNITGGKKKRKKTPSYAPMFMLLVCFLESLHKTLRS